MIPGVGDLLRATLRLYRSSLALLSGYLAWLLLPQIGFVLVEFIPSDAWQTSLGLLLMVVYIVLSVWVTLIVLRILSAAATGKHESLPTVIESSRDRFLPFIGTGIIQSLTILGGFILLVIPGLVFAVWYGFSSLEAALGNSRGLSALSASRTLSRKRFFPVAWRMLAGPLVLIVWYAVAMSIIFLPLLVLTGTPLEAVSGNNPPLWFVVFDAVGQLFVLTPLLLGYIVLLYHSLAVESVGADGAKGA